MGRNARKHIIAAIIALFLICPLTASAKDKSCDKPAKSCKIEKNQVKTFRTPLYQLLFFRNDGRVWITLPAKTTLIEIYPSESNKRGWVKAYNRWEQILALDMDFNGDVISGTNSEKTGFKKNRFVISMHDGRAVGILTPPKASYVEIYNAKNGFDGVVKILDCNMKVLAKQSGLDLQIVNYE